MLEDSGHEVIRNPHGRPFTEEELRTLIKDVDGIIVGLDAISREVIAAAEKLKVISKYGVGVDNIDLEAARAKGIIVTYTPSSNSEAVADLTMGLLLAAARRIPSADRAVRSGDWRKVVGLAVWKKTIGVVGVGRIGRGVVKRASGFNMKILCCDKVMDSDFAARYGAEYVSLDFLLQQSDFVTLHVPLTDETRGLIGEKELSQMKRTAILINTARGEVVDEDALYQALVGGRIAGAALDVFRNEPPIGSRLLELDNVILTPHIGAHTDEAITEMGCKAVRNLMAVLNGELPEAVAW
ncbi:MAG: phosphoglycerate dehydrogenase [Firmicutes bacterium]|nr:phosphoglycerate dehydrogenase [Bacillota bacterium]